MAPNPRTFMEISIDDAPIGRVVFELFADKVPRTAENFRVLSTGEAGVSAKSAIPLSYAGSLFHRVIPEFMLQCGDFTKKDGTGGESIYGGVFEDEDLSTPVDREGLLVMANKGPNTNGSQVFMTLAPAPHLDGKHCVFGKVVSGYEHLKTIEALPTDKKDRPLQTVSISRCGELELQKRPAESADARKASPPRRRRSSSSSGSDSEDDRRRRKSSSKKKSRRHSDSDSSSGSDSDSDDDRRRSSKKKSKSSKRKSKSSKKSSRKDKSSTKDDGEGAEPKEREETDAEMDARFEREDREKEAERKRLELEAIRIRLKREEEDRQRSGGDGGVRYKGRGAMRFSENAPTPVLPSYAREYHARPAYNPNNDSNGAPRDRTAPRLAQTWQHDLALGGSGERFVREKQPEQLGERGGYEDRDGGAADKEKDTKEVEEAVAAGQAGVEVDEGPVMEEEEVDSRRSE